MTLALETNCGERAEQLHQLANRATRGEGNSHLPTVTIASRYAGSTMSTKPTHSLPSNATGTPGTTSVEKSKPLTRSRPFPLSP